MKKFIFIVPLLLTVQLNATGIILDTTTSLIWQDSSINEDALVT
jgi:hypothetical protein